ncbi:MAG: thiamine pyrophosphate-binding protein [Deltaproteobacteria bacterium]|nr:thiamine pyrophosphate-binding protein [Deltaproteobacteria bacterium]MBW2396162.1 thiamine pyrophosphate-binding protein [Deltaproteobacteria bacterium]
MGQKNGGEILVEMLERAGIRQFFTLHGGHLDSIFMAAEARGFAMTDMRHEQAAVHAADGWARATGEPGVAVVTSGPGVANAVSGVVNAHVDAIPMLVIGGANPASEDERLPLAGGYDQVALMAPVTKWAHRIPKIERVADQVAQALRIATTGRPGPVYLEIPIDVAFTQIDEEAIHWPSETAPTTQPCPTPQAVETAIEWLHSAERPAILLGSGAWFSDLRANLGSDLLDFVERTQIPVFSNSRAHGLIPADHPLCARNIMNLALLDRESTGGPDTVLVLGARLGLFTGGAGDRMLPRNAKLIQVDIEPEEIGRNRDVDLAISADCGETVRALCSVARERSWPARESWVQATRAASEMHRVMFGSALTEAKTPIHPYVLADAIVEAAGRESILVAEGGGTSSWMEMTAQVYKGGHWLSHGYLAQLGTGMPFAIAAQQANPDKRVICVLGDGAVGFNFAEFDTMVRHGLPVVVVVNNDQQWGMSAHGQDLIYGEGHRVVTDLGATRYDLAAVGFGCHGEHVVDPGDLLPALSRALASGKPACVNVMTDPSVISLITLALVGGASEAGLTGERKELRYLP